jgi:hypothetical protein
MKWLRSKKLYLFPVTIIFLFSNIITGYAISKSQGIDIQLVDGTVPVSHELNQQLLSYLQSNPPTSTNYYAVTYNQVGLDSHIICVVALDLSAPDEPWSVSGTDENPSKVIWRGTIKLYSNGSGGELLSKEPNNKKELASLSWPNMSTVLPSPGGSNKLSFPWRTGKYMAYGVFGTHFNHVDGPCVPNCGSEQMMWAVDFLSGTNGGFSAAPDTAYTSDSGTIDWICESEGLDEIRTYNSTTGDYFVYGLLVPNESLIIGHQFSRRAPIAGMIHSDFGVISPCGANWMFDYHESWALHWGFVPSSNDFKGSFIVDGCVLKKSDTLDFFAWKCSENWIGLNGRLVSHGGAGGGVDDPTGTTGGAVGVRYNFWDGVINGVVTIAAKVFDLLPEHNSPALLLKILFNAISLGFRLTYVFIRGNFALSSMAVIIGFAIVFRLAMGIIYFIIWAFRIVSFIFRG